MIETIRNLYTTPDLTDGEFLLKPLKAYENFFAKKIENNVGLTNIILKIIHIATNIIVYPVLGLLAGTGMLIKLSGLPALKAYNEEQKNSFQAIHENIALWIQKLEPKPNVKPETFEVNSYRKINSGLQSETEGEIFDLTIISDDAEGKSKENQNRIAHFSKIAFEEIDSLTNRFRKAHLSGNGTEREGNLVIQVEIYHRV